MANRFSAWRSIIKDLVNYFKEYSSVQEEIIRQQSRLQQAVGQITNTANNNSNYNNNTTLTVRLKLSITFLTHR